MVKRGGKFNPEHKGWEWFMLEEPSGEIGKENDMPMRGANLMEGMCNSLPCTSAGKGLCFFERAIKKMCRKSIIVRNIIGQRLFEAWVFLPQIAQIYANKILFVGCENRRNKWTITKKIA